MSRPKSLILLLILAFLGIGAVEGSPIQGRGSEPAPDLPEIRTERLGNGLRVIYLPRVNSPPGRDGRTEIAFGYTAGARNEQGYPRGVAQLVQAYLANSVTARSVALAVHLAGGSFEFLQERDLVGMRVAVPSGLVAIVLDQIAAYFNDARLDLETLEYARSLILEHALGTPSDEATRFGREVDSTLLGDHPYVWSKSADPGEIDRLQIDDLQQYFEDNFGTDRAYVILPETIPAAALETLSAVEPRVSITSPGSVPVLGAEEIALEFPSQSQGGVILATRVPSVHFEAWFHSLVIDRFLRQAVGPEAGFEFGFSVDSSMHRIEIPVEIPLFSEDVRDSVLNTIRQLPFQIPEPERLQVAVEDAIEFLGQRPVLKWFAAQGLWEALREGWNAIRNLTPDSFRSAARDFDSARRVVATWPPRIEQPQVRVENLSEDSPLSVEVPPEIRRAPGEVPVPPFDEVSVREGSPIRVDRLVSGITLAEDSRHAIFVAGRFESTLTGGEALRGTNGALWSFPNAPDREVWDQLSEVRPDRILFFFPASELTSARGRFRDWTSGRLDSTPSLSVGPVSTGDLPSLVVLKTWLDTKLIEAGWWGQVGLDIVGTEGSRLLIEADPGREEQIRAWISDVAMEGLSDDEFLRVRSAAGGYFDSIRRELHILLWQRDPRGMIRPPSSVTQSRLRDVARIYF